MPKVWKVTVLTGTAVVIAVISTIVYRAVHRIGARNLTGVVLVDDADVMKRRPIANVIVEVPGKSSTVTDASGLFRLKLSSASLLKGVLPDSIPVTLQHPEFKTVYATLPVDGELYVLRMKSDIAPARAVAEIPVSDIRVRYTESARTSTDTGSALKSFDVVNTGNVPCEGRQPCSPDGKWKAAIGGASLDAGEGNEFREARVSCIAGPCPFTRIETDGFSRNGRNISVTVRDWSDTASFVLEAEVTRTTMSDLIRVSYPLIFGRGLNFTLPPSGEGPSIEASVAGQQIVYPMGPDLSTSWVNCTLQVAKDQMKSYRCDLKPGYRFQ